MVRDSRVWNGRRTLPALAVALALATAIPGGVRAQDDAPAGSVAEQQVPSSNQGPQFGEWGPGRGAPGGAQQVPPLQAPAPGAPSPGAPSPGVPSPSWGGCGYNLSGTWQASGEETTPTAFLYDGTVVVTQYGQWIQATETQGGGQTQYYGQCNGNFLRFDVYSNGQFIGYQSGNIEPGGRWGQARINFDWTTYAPNFASGREHWRRGGPFY